MATKSNPILTKARRTIRAYRAENLTDRDALTCALIEDLADAYAGLGVRDRLSASREIRMLLDTLPKPTEEESSDAAQDFLDSFADDDG